MCKRPPPHVLPIRIASPMPPLPTNPSFGCLLRVPSKWRPPKTGAPPISQFVDGHHFGAPNKGTKLCAREPGRWAPLLGSSGAAAPLFRSMADDAFEREGKAAGGRVAAQGLILSCVCCVCVSFFCLCFVDCRVGAPTTAKFSPPQNSADDGPPREMSTTQSSSHSEDD
jgi:hypothetical protein